LKQPEQANQQFDLFRQLRPQGAPVN
jgi:hypothetical protein